MRQQGDTTAAVQFREALALLRVGTPVADWPQPLQQMMQSRCVAADDERVRGIYTLYWSNQSRKAHNARSKSTGKLLTVLRTTSDMEPEAADGALPPAGWMKELEEAKRDLLAKIGDHSDLEVSELPRRDQA